jgi:hypothetical protein
MTTELTILNNAAIQQGGLGIDQNSKYLKNVKPATVTIVQPNTQIEGATKGSLYIKDSGTTGFNELRCTLLQMPHESRSYYIGQPGELNRTPENLVCFSHDLVVPHTKAKIPQALSCASCSKSDWTPWREYKEQNGTSNKALIPPCESQILALMIDTTLKMPLRMFIRSTAKDTFDAGMEQIARMILMRQAAGQNPNIFDISFKLSTKLVQRGKYQSYVPVVSDARFITPEERVQFGAVYTQYINSQSKPAQESNSDIKDQQEKINDTVTEGEYLNEDGDIKI